VPGDVGGEALQFVGLGQITVQEQPGDLDKRALLGELGDVVAAVAKDAFFAVDERDGAAARARVAKTGVQGDEAGRRSQFLEVGLQASLIDVFFIASSFM